MVTKITIYTYKENIIWLTEFHCIKYPLNFREFMHLYFRNSLTKSVFIKFLSPQFSNPYLDLENYCDCLVCWYVLDDNINLTSSANLEHWYVACMGEQELKQKHGKASWWLRDQDEVHYLNNLTKRKWTSG